MRPCLRRRARDVEGRRRAGAERNGKKKRDELLHPGSYTVSEERHVDLAQRSRADGCHIPGMRVCRNVLALGLFTVALACARLASADEYPIYDLAVSFDLTRAKIAGTATIEAKPGARLVIHRGDLRILSLATGGRNAVPDALAPDPLVVQAAGPGRIRYEGTFSGGGPDPVDAHR